MQKLLNQIRNLLLAVLLIWGVAFAGVAWALDYSLVGLTIVTGTGPTSAASSGSLLQPPTSTLSPGEVLVQKSIVYNADTPPAPPYNGTITVTLSVWAQTYTNSDGVLSNPLVPMVSPSGVFVEVTDDIGVFELLTVDTSPLPAGVTLNTSSNPIVLDITDQSVILGAAPLEVSYTITVANPALQPYIPGFWYSTGIAHATFEPAGDNPYYYTMTETTYDEFLMSMNWNNGNGLNNGAIIDNDLGYTIVFPANISAQNMHAYNADGTMNTSGQWNWWPQNTNTRNQAATVVTAAGTTYYTWHLQWAQGNTAKTYIFTVKDLAGPGLDVQYEIDFPQGGGSQAFAGGKTVVSEDYFQKKMN